MNPPRPRWRVTLFHDGTPLVHVCVVTWSQVKGLYKSIPKGPGWEVRHERIDADA